MSKNDNNDPKAKPSSSPQDPFVHQMGVMFENLMDVFTQTTKVAADTVGTAQANPLFKTPEYLELMGKAGAALKDMRDTAGLSLQELSSAIDIDNPNVLKGIEDGHAALPMDLMLRLASFYSRNDPLPFIFRFSRTYHPELASLLSKTGMDRMFIQAERELKFVNIYRNADSARKLSNEGFDRVIDFTQKAFSMALHFVSEQEGRLESEPKEKNQS